jgi:hypothetical protein
MSFDFYLAVSARDLEPPRGTYETKLSGTLELFEFWDPSPRLLRVRELVAITFLEIRFLGVWSALKAKVYVISENRHRCGKVTICVGRHPFFESRPQRFAFGRSKLRSSDNDADRYYEKILWKCFHLSLSFWFLWKRIVPLADICASLLWKLDMFTLEIRFKIKLISHHWSVSSSLTTNQHK